jgi:hypothetical protein
MFVGEKVKKMEEPRNEGTTSKRHYKERQRQTVDERV